MVRHAPAPVHPSKQGTRGHIERNPRARRHSPRIRRDAGHLRLRQPLHHPQHQVQRVHHGRGLLGLPPLLHRQAEDPRCRRSRRALRGAVRQADRSQEVATQTAPTAAVGAVLVSGGGPVAAPTVDALLMEYAELERALADPSVHADAGQARKLGRRYAELGQVVGAARELESVRSDLAAARELAVEDAGFAEEADELAARIPELETRLAQLLVPRDPHDGDDVVMEIKSGEGGEESALFAGDLARMYLRYAERRGWKAEVLGGTDSDLGGYKDVTLLIRSRASDPDGVWAALKYEGGVHRVQRVPVTESQGRVHTSAAGVLVYPDTGDDAAVEIDEKDLRIDVFR